MSAPVLPHRRDLRQGDLVFPEEILRIGHKLDFQFDCVSDQIQRELFGPELDTGRIGDWLDLYAAYDMALQDVVDHVDVTLCRDNGLPILVFDLGDGSNIARAVRGEKIGTLVCE